MSEWDKNIEKEIRDAFHKDELSAPEGLWDKIDKQTQLSQDDRIIQEAYEPGKDNWSKIQKNVIINEVWDDLSDHLNKRRRVLPLWYIDSGIALILTILVFGFNPAPRYHYQNMKVNIDRVESKPLSQSIPAEYILHERNSTDINKGTSHSANENRIKTEVTSVNNTRVSPGEKGKAAKGQNPIPSLSISKTRESKEDNQPQNTSFKDIAQLPLKETQRIKTDSIGELTLQKPPFEKQFSIGFQVEVGNSWIMNNTIRDGLTSESLSQSKFSGGWGLGILTKYDFNRRFGIKAEYLFLSELNQNYSKYEGGMLNDYGIQLSVNKFRLSGTVSFLNDTKYFSDFHFGGFISHINEKKLNVMKSSSEFDAPANLKNMDYGLTLGLDMHHQLNERFNLFYGVFSDIGLANLHSEENSKLPSKFNYTNTLVFGLRGGLQINW